MRLVAHPVAIGDAGAARDRHDVGGASGRGLLLAGDLVDARFGAIKRHAQRSPIPSAGWLQR
jgi:hypothetical protein